MMVMVHVVWSGSLEELLVALTPGPTVLCILRHLRSRHQTQQHRVDNNACAIYVQVTQNILPPENTLDNNL